MNRTQKYMVIAGVFVFIMMGIVPPWIQYYKTRESYKVMYRGYLPIISPPVPEPGIPRGNLYTEIDTTRLFIQWFILFVSTSAFVIVSRNDKKKLEIIGAKNGNNCFKYSYEPNTKQDKKFS